MRPSEQENPQPFQSFASLSAQEISWCPDTQTATFAVLTTGNRAVLCDLDGGQKVVAQNASSGELDRTAYTLRPKTREALTVMWLLVVDSELESFGQLAGCWYYQRFRHHVFARVAGGGENN
jgi:hypothetical protein